MADADRLAFAFSSRPGDELPLDFGGAFIWDLTASNPTNQACDFCDAPEQADAYSLFDVAIPLAGGRVALKGTLGMMRPGYMLGVTREHLTSFAQLAPLDLGEINDAFSSVEQRLRADLGYNAFVRLEHGSDNIESCGLGAGACVAHAHQHLIPATPFTAERMLDQEIAWQQLDSYEDLSSLRGKPYLYVGCDRGHFAAIDPKVKSQWGRRIIAQEDGHNDWDWALFSGAVHLLQTFFSLDAMPAGRVELFRPDGEVVYYPRRRRSSVS